MKYSINGTGNIVAERDIHSLGGFIPKGTVGGKIARESQLSQDGECWLARGDISTRPDIRIKDNAYVGTFTPGANPVHTDGVTEFSGNTLIPGNILVRSFVTDTKNNVFIKDSFIGVSMDVLCGPSTTATAFPFEQGLYSVNSAEGTLFANMASTSTSVNSCRGIAALRLGKDTKIYVPTGLRCQVLWGYYNTAGQEAYSGRYTEYSPGLHTISDPVYSIARLHFWKIDGTAMTPANLLATGAKILGHISGSLSQDFRPESTSGQYVMDKSSFLMNTDNFGLSTTQLRFLAGGMYNTTMYTKTDRQDYKSYGTFRNVERLEYNQYLPDGNRVNANRDRYIVASDSPLVRINEGFLSDSVANAGGVTLRRCIVPKAIFIDNLHNSNVYEDIDFSYAVDHLVEKAGGTNDLCSSHIQGLYSVVAARAAILGFVSRPGNLASGSELSSKIVNVPLGGDIIEQGTYAAVIGQFYEDGKSGVANTRLRTGKPVSTRNMNLPDMPSGYILAAAHYLDEGFKFAGSVTNPTSINTAYPYVVFVITKTDSTETALAAEFIAFNKTMTYYDLSRVPEITGSAYVGARCAVRGDVKLIGDPYVNRVFDVNMWERGSGATTTGGTWEATKAPEPAGYPRLRTRGVFPVDTTVDNNFTCASGYQMLIYYFGGDGKCSGRSPWGTSLKVSDPAVAYISILVSKTNGIDFIGDSDIPLANVKYVRAFKKRRYITNELDRTSPEDILLKPGDFGNYYVGRIPGETYDSKKGRDANYLALFRPVNVPGIGATINLAAGFTPSYGSLDALTKFISKDLSLIPDTVFFGGGFGKSPAAAILPSEAPDARFIIEFTPSPRIVVPYGSSTLFISGPKIRMYDNAVLSACQLQGQDVVLKDNAVMGNTPSACVCGNGHNNAIIKLP